MEKREIHCQADFFPSNQFIVNSAFSKTLLWRNFNGKIVAVKFCNYHSVQKVKHTHCGNCENSLSRILGKNFMKILWKCFKITVLLNKLLKSWFDEILFDERKFLVLIFHTVLPMENISWNQLTSYPYSFKHTVHSHFEIFRENSLF